MSLVGVSGNMVSQRLLPGGDEVAARLRTAPRDACMHQFVRPERAVVGSGVATSITKVPLLSRMHQGVADESLLPLEASAALGAKKRRCCRVLRKMCCEGRASAESSITFQAEKGQVVPVQ